MLNIVYLVVFVLGSDGVTSQNIPQANMKQCLVNATVFNSSNKSMLPNQWSTRHTQKAYCIVGVK